MEPKSEAQAGLLADRERAELFGEAVRPLAPRPPLLARFLSGKFGFPGTKQVQFIFDPSVPLLSSRHPSKSWTRKVRPHLVLSQSVPALPT